MRVLYFHQYFCTPAGNSGIRSYGMAKQLLANGHHVTMVFAESPRLKSPLADVPYVNGVRRGQFEGIDLIEFNIQYSNKFSLLKRAMIFLQFSFKSIRLVFTEQYDLVYATTTPLTAGIPGIIMKFFGKKKPFVFEVRDLWPELPKAMGVIKNKAVLWALGVLEYYSYNKADACVALSPGIAEGIKKRLKKDKPVYLIPNGCDLQIFKPGKQPRTIIPGISEDDFVAVFTGAHGFANGLDNALNAAEYLQTKTTHRHIKFVFIGDGVLKAKLKETAAKKGLSNCVFINPVPKLELAKYLEAADCGLMLLANIPAFYYGTSPNKFFDYIAMGMPILNNYPGWLAEMINTHELGIAVPPDNPEAFANALITMSKDPQRVQQMGKNARAFAEKHFDREKLANELTAALEKTFTNFNKGKK